MYFHFLITDDGTVLLRRNITGNPNANLYTTGTEQVQEREWNRNRTTTEQISNGYGTVTDHKKEKKHSLEH